MRPALLTLQYIGVEIKGMPNRLNALAKKLDSFVHLTEQEIGCLADLQSAPSQVGRSSDLVQEGQTGHQAYVLHDGWVCNYKVLPDGGRQIITFSIPGDCLGMRSILLRTADHSVSTLSKSVVSTIDTGRLLHAFKDFPRLGRAILWAASRDEALVVEHLVNVGRRNALERTAYFFLELHERLELVGLTKGHEYPCPLSQYVLADTLGLSAIYVNRVLRQLRERNLMTLTRGKATIQDKDELMRLAGFERQQAGRLL